MLKKPTTSCYSKKTPFSALEELQKSILTLHATCSTNFVKHLEENGLNGLSTFYKKGDTSILWAAITY